MNECTTCLQETNQQLNCDECYDDICAKCVEHPLGDDGLKDTDISLCLDCKADHKYKNPEVYAREERLSHYL